MLATASAGALLSGALLSGAATFLTGTPAVCRSFEDVEISDISLEDYIAVKVRR